MSTLVSVVVPTYRRPEMLERCLKALLAQRFPADAFEIVVADDGPDEATRRTVRELALRTGGAPEIRYVPVTGSQGPAGARNRGWEAADSPVIAFTDDDTLPQPGWLVEGFQVILASPRHLAATGRVVMPRARCGARSSSRSRIPPYRPARGLSRNPWACGPWATAPRRALSPPGV